MTKKRTRTKVGRLRRTARRVKTSRVGRQARLIYRGTRKTMRRSRKIRRKLRRHDLGLIASLIGVVTTSLLVVFVGVGSAVTIVTGIGTILVGGTTWVWRKSTPAEQIHVRRTGKLDVLTADEKRKKAKEKTSDGASASGVYREGVGDKILALLRGGSSGDRRRPLDGRRPCGARCQRSTAPVDMCECSCQGAMHGSRRSVLVPSPSPSSPAQTPPSRTRTYRGTSRGPRLVSKRIAGRTKRS